MLKLMLLHPNKLHLSNSAQQGLLADKFRNEAALAVAQGKESTLAELDKENEEAIKVCLKRTWLYPSKT